MEKILILSTVHIINDVRIYYKEIESLKKKYSNIFYMVQADKNDLEEFKNVNIIPLPKVNSELSRIFKLQFFAIGKIIKLKPNLIHFHDPELLFLMFFCKIFLKTKIIFDVHENILGSLKEKTWLPEFLKKIILKIYPKLESYIINKFDGIILAEKSYSKIYNCNHIEILNYPILIDSKPDKNFEEELSFIYSGSVTELRGVFVILNIFKKLIIEYNLLCKLYIVGNIYPQNLEEKINRFISDNKLTNHILCLNRMSYIELQNIYSKSHIGLALLAPISNHLESLPTKIFEYMMFGLPVIVSKFEIYDEYVLQPITGITIDYDNIKESAIAIRNLTNNKARLIEMSENGKNNVWEKWNWNSEEKKLLNLYHNVLS